MQRLGWRWKSQALVCEQSRSARGLLPTASCAARCFEQARSGHRAGLREVRCADDRQYDDNGALLSYTTVPETGKSREDSLGHVG